MARIVVVEDDPFFRKAIRQMLGVQHEIIDCPVPEAIGAVDDPETITHALVDLSYGSYDRFGRTPRPNGLDAIVLLETLAPHCDRLVMSVLAEPTYFELARAVYQFWPDTTILSKLHMPHFEEMITRFVAGQETSSHEAGVRATQSVNTMPNWQTVVPLQMVARSVGNPYSLIEAVASFPYEPTNAEVAQRLGVKAARGIAVRFHDFRTRFEYWLTEPDFQKGARLWHWMAPRLPIFRHVRPTDY